MMQLDLFTQIVEPKQADLVGIDVQMPTPCPRCGASVASIGHGKGPHMASLLCICGRFAGWLSIQSYQFIEEVVRQFGRPTSPIVVRPPRSSGGVAAAHPTEPST